MALDTRLDEMNQKKYSSWGKGQRNDVCLRLAGLVFIHHYAAELWMSEYRFSHQNTVIDNYSRMTWLEGSDRGR